MKSNLDTNLRILWDIILTILTGGLWLLWKLFKFIRTH